MVGLSLTISCAKVPETKPTTVAEVPLPEEIDDMDASKLVPTDKTQNCRRAPALKTAAKHRESTLAGGGVYGTYDWAAGKTNGGQAWKTRLAYTKSNLSQVRLVPTFTEIGNVGTQLKLAKKVKAIAYVNGDFFNLRGTKNLFSAMVENDQLVYAPKATTPIVGVVEQAANEHTGMQGASYIKVRSKKIVTQGLNLIYLEDNMIGAYSSIKTTAGLPKVSYVVTVSAGVVTSSKEATDFALPKEADGYVFVANGTGVDLLKTLKKGDQVTYVKPKKAKTTKLLRSGLTVNGQIKLPNKEVIAIRAVNHNGEKINSGAVLYNSKLYPSTSKLAATVVTDSAGVVTAVYANGKAINVKGNQLVIQVGAGSAAAVRKLKVGDKLKISNTFKTNKNLPLFSAFGNRQNTMVDGVIIAKCSSSYEDIRPRNVFAWNENGDVWFATTTMGVRNAADVFNRFRLGGSTVHQLTTWLKELGATQATMLDGGGSATMYVKKQSGSYMRLDLPATEWVRPVPQGVAMVVR